MNTNSNFSLPPFPNGWFRVACSDQLPPKKVIPLLTELVESKMSEGTAKAIEQDIPIWENQVYRRHPLLCEGDGPIRQYRSWSRQFYSDPSGKVSTLEKTTNLT